MAKKSTVILVLLTAALLAGCAVYTAGPAGSGGYGYQAAPVAPPGSPSAPPPPPQATVTVVPEFLFFMPAFSAYFLPNVGLDIFFYGDRWYYRAEGHWYWGNTYRGPWTWVEPRHVPGPVLKIPPGYRGESNVYRKVPLNKWEERGHPKKWKDRWDREDDDSQRNRRGGDDD